MRPRDFPEATEFAPRALPTLAGAHPQAGPHAGTWAEMEKFRAAANKMQEEMAKLNVVAKGGNLDAIKAAVGETGESCKACHDNYRKE